MAEPLASNQLGARPLRLAVGLALGLALLAGAWPAAAPRASELIQTIKRVKPSVVGIGTFQATRRPPVRLLGTGFAVADGSHVITSKHVLPTSVDRENKEFIAIFTASGRQGQARPVTTVAVDNEHDLVVLKIAGKPLPALTLGDDTRLQEGQRIAITGFPIGPVLGLHAATYRGIVAAIAPAAIPQLSANRLDVRMIKELRARAPVFQLDATAFPGNSGSPLYDAETGVVYGVINSVFVKETKERVLQDPSGITYATPIRYARALLRELGLAQ